MASSAVTLLGSRKGADWPSFGRRGVASAGPAMVSVAHFALSGLMLHYLPASQFGTIAFALVTIALCVSVNGALVGFPATIVAARACPTAQTNQFHFISIGVIFAGSAGVLVALTLIAMHAGVLLSVLMGSFCWLTCIRGLGRSYGYILRAPLSIALSDFLYAAILLSLVFALTAMKDITANTLAVTLNISALAGLLVLNRQYIHAIVKSHLQVRLAGYGSVFKDISGWSLLGVVTTEFTANAHAYIVTLVSGPSSYALLALGALLMRPVQMVTGAVNDLERPLISRHFALREFHACAAITKSSRQLFIGVWMLAAGAGLGLIEIFPGWVTKGAYPLSQVHWVFAIWSTIILVRAIRSPDSLILQGSSRYQELALASVGSAVLSLCLTALLLVCFGPVQSMAGVLMGDLYLSYSVSRLLRTMRPEMKLMDAKI
jgi:hypothetical protein